jgi:6-phosphogluconate dehydrogenase
MTMQEIGVIGMAVMGRNLALNIADHGYGVSVYNRSAERTKLMLEEGKGKNIVASYTIEDFVNSLKTPRKIIMMIKSGPAVDNMIGKLLPLLSPKDILIDGGNSYYKDTERRSKELENLGVYYIGAGISGGEEGARTGPAIMPGGDKEAYKQIEKIFTDISAKVDGEPCCTYIGKGGAGHFVKMVHNGIEYGDMQLICEAYSILKNLLSMSAPELSETFRKWNEGELNSYLIKITSDIFTKIDDESGEYLVDLILDVAEQKGTGKWTSRVALDMGAVTPTITEAVFQRYISSLKDERLEASRKLSGPAQIGDKASPGVEAVRRALYASKICTYAQGFSLMKIASEENQWQLNLGDIASIFRGGCIIRAAFLDDIKNAYHKNPDLQNLMLDDYFSKILKEYQKEWRELAAMAISAGIAIPAFTSALSYYDSYRSAELPMNLLQAQRDYFGAHTYKRKDKEGIFHTQW